MAESVPNGLCLAVYLFFPVGCFPRHPCFASLAPTKGQCEHSHLPVHMSLCLLATLLAWPLRIAHRRLHCWSLPCLAATVVLPQRRQASPALCLAITWCFCHCPSVRVFRGAGLGPSGLTLRVIPAGLGPCMPAFLTCRYILTRCCCHSATPRIPHSLRAQAPGSSECFWRPSVALRSACLLSSQCFGHIPRSLACSLVR